MAAWIKMSLGIEVGLGPGDFVLDGDPVAPSPKGGRPPNFRPMFIVTMVNRSYNHNAAGWMKLVLGMVVGLSPGEFVLDRDPTAPPKGAEPPPQV